MVKDNPTNNDIICETGICSINNVLPLIKRCHFSDSPGLKSVAREFERYFDVAKQSLVFFRLFGPLKIKELVFAAYYRKTKLVRLFQKFKRVYHLGCILLAVPATSSSAEKLFDTALLHKDANKKFFEPEIVGLHALRNFNRYARLLTINLS